KRDQDAHVGERPGAALAAQAERAEQVTLPGQPAGRTVGHQAPADRRTDHHQADGQPADVAVPAAPVVQLGLGVVAAAQQDVGQHDAAPGRDRHAQSDQEAFELHQEGAAGHEYHVDRAEDHHGAVDQRRDVPRHRHADAEHGQPGGVDVQHRAADQAEHRDDGERDQVPGGQQGG